MGSEAMPPPQVLVVDDTQANLVAMRAILHTLDAELVEARSGSEALTLAADASFALALIDVQMPSMDGFDLTRRLRATPNGRELPIILVTALEDDERYMREGYAAGAADYLTKPLDIDAVRARVRAFLDLFRQRERLRVIEVGERTRERDDALGRLAELLRGERFARREAELANATKDAFVAMVSHELRTPLSAIVGWASMARTLPPGPDLARALETIERKAREQDRMIEDLLDMSRLTAGTLRLEMSDISVDEVIESAASTLAPAACKKSVEVIVDARAGMIRADSSRLEQVVSNLLSNAIKFTPAAGRVIVAGTREDDGVEIAVTDTGVGIAPEFLHEVFEPFRQGEGAPSRRHGGLGLGLAIVKHVVEAHGGTIHVTSGGRNQGATFVVRLPLVADESAGGHRFPASGTMRARSA